MGAQLSTQRQLVIGGVLLHLAVIAKGKSPRISLLTKMLALLQGEQLWKVALGDFIGLSVLLVILRHFRYLRRLRLKDYKNIVGGFAFEIMKVIPYTAKKIDDENRKMEKQIQDSLKGISDKEIVRQMTEWAEKEDGRWKSGKVSGAVYHGDEGHLQLLNKAYSLFSVANPLHADIWPSIVQMEAEICSMTANLLNGGDKGVCGCMSSGGTESILLATKSHRSWGYSRGIRHPEIIAGTTAHAGIDKACEILGIRLVKVPVNSKTFQLEVKEVKKHINADTIMIYASAPNFPQGTIDDIEGLSALAYQYKVGLHVDCCLGGYVLPFAKMLGYDIPPFDFSCPGVTSMSVDTHKYGYASKGTSVVLYRDKRLRRFQYFTFPEWTGGLYVTPSVPGSRPGGLIAACWASLVHIGLEGFKEITEGIIKGAQRIKQAIEEDIPGLYVLGEPKAMVVCFSSSEFSIYEVGDLLASRGWSLNALQHPASLHFALTRAHLGHVEEFIEALKEATDEVRKAPKKAKQEGSSAIYGMASTLPAGPVGEILQTYVDVTLTP